MTVQTPDRDDIFAAVGLASAAEGDAFLADAGEGNPTLRGQMEKMLAVSLPTASAPHPSHSAASRPHAAPETSATALPAHPLAPQSAAAHAAFSWLTAATLILLATSVASAGAAIWALRAESNWRQQALDAVRESEEAVKVQKEYEQLIGQHEVARAETARERDQALAAGKTLQTAFDDAQAVQSFLQERVLSTARPGAWSGSEGKDVTLRKAVDLAEPKIAAAYADRPLVEAALREILGAIYSDLDDVKSATKQYERAFALRKAVLGPNHPSTVTCRNKLAVTYRAANRTAEAGQLFNSTGKN